jgi:AcrR family transcriptional regulator
MPRTQAERSAATRGALIAAARRLWGDRGYAEVGTPQIAAAAGVTRGAMYHQYADKTDLLRAVIESAEAEVIERLSAAVSAAQPRTPVDALYIAADAWLEIAGEPDIRQLLLIDGPSVLGAESREISRRYALGMTEQLLGAATDGGYITPQPVHALATILLGAMNDAALYIARAEDADQAHADARTVVHALIDGLLDPAGRG